MPRTLKTIVAVAAISFSASTGLAQGGLNFDVQDEAAVREVPRPPIARKAEDKPPALWNFTAFFVILAAVFGANMIPSKRGHQD